MSLYTTYRSWLLNFLSSLSSHTLCIFLTPSLLPFLCIHPWLPFIFPLCLLFSDTSLGDARQLQLSHVATPVARFTAAPQAMASTTMMWCASPATKATPWKDPPQPSARPAASGAGSHRRAEVRSSYRVPAEWLNDWQLGWLKVSDGCRCMLTV